MNFPKYRIFDNDHGEELKKFHYTDDLPEGMSYADFWVWVQTHSRIPEENLQACIGMKDKTGKDIYAGDIVQLSGRDTFDLLKERYQVVWNPKRSGFEFKNLIPKRGSFVPIDNYYDSYEIIGNIFETPELITECM